MHVLRGLSDGVSKARQIAPPVWSDHSLNPLKLINGGEFVMGSAEVDSDDEDREHKVTVSSFTIQEHEVTNEEYWRFDPMRVPPGHADVPDQFKILIDRSPVTKVTWFDAMAYAAWLGGGLPTEAEWELAARGVEGRSFPWGEAEITCSRAIHAGCFPPRLAPVSAERGEDGRTPDGVYDLAGNVWEWCRDWAGPYEGDGLVNPLGPPSGSARVMRGAVATSALTEAASFRRCSSSSTVAGICG